MRSKAAALVILIFAVRCEPFLLGLILSELFEDLSATLAAMDLADPILFGDAVVVVSAQMFIADADLWRRVAPEVSGLFASSVQPYVSFQPINLQRHAMARAKAQGLLSRAADPHVTAMHIYAAYVGALTLWAGGVLSNPEFVSQAQSGYWAVLAAFGSGSERRRAQQNLKSLHQTAPMPGGLAGESLSTRTLRGCIGRYFSTARFFWASSTPAVWSSAPPRPPPKAIPPTTSRIAETAE